MNKIKQFEYKFPDGFFDPANVVKNIKNELAIIKSTILKTGKDEIKSRVNSLGEITSTHKYRKKIDLELQVLFLDFLVDYAIYYNSQETFENIIIQLDKEELKQQLSSSYPVMYKKIYAISLIGRFNVFLHHSHDKFPLGKLNDLLKAKYLLTTLVVNHIEDKHRLEDFTYQNCLNALSTLLLQIKRWSEALYYLNSLNAKSIQFQANYLKAIALNSIREETCLNYNGLLLLSIIDCSSTFKPINAIPNPDQKIQMETLNKEIRRFCRENSISISELRIHNKKSTDKKIKDYKNYVSKNDLYLNEHSFFCDCNQSLKDNLEIETNHKHTKVEWLKKYCKTLEIIKSSFILSRAQFYKSFSKKGLHGYNLTSSKNKKEFRNTLLKSSFRGLYSILDQIGISVLDALNIDHKSILLERGTEKHIYFLNMWDLNLIEEKEIRRNPFIFTLFSIAKDLDRTKLAALKSFKNIRNSIEHKILVIDDNQIENKKGDYYYLPYDLLKKRTLILLRLTRSAIFTYTYFLRWESRFKMKSEDHESKNKND